MKAKSYKVFSYVLGFSDGSIGVECAPCATVDTSRGEMPFGDLRAGDLVLLGNVYRRLEYVTSRPSGERPYRPKKIVLYGE